MIEKTVNVGVAMLKSTLDKIKKKAGTIQTKAAMEAMIDSYLADEGKR